MMSPVAMISKTKSKGAAEARTQPIIGGRIRELRKAKRMTLQQLAVETGLSTGYLSQLEREDAVPSIRALNVIARTLGVGINWFFPDPERESSPHSHIVVRAKKRRALRFESGLKDELLSPTLSGQLELVLCTFEPGASSGDDPYFHEGEEAGYVVKGRLELMVDGEIMILGPGDSFHFESKLPHRYRNPSAVKTVVVWAITPPNY